jgi:hypothetical protein
MFFLPVDFFSPSPVISTSVVAVIQLSRRSMASFARAYCNYEVRQKLPENAESIPETEGSGSNKQFFDNSPSATLFCSR